MEKPISIRAQEFKENLVNLINNSDLIPMIIEPIMKDIYMEIKTLKEEQYQNDKIKYQQFLEKGESNEQDKF